MDKAFWLAKRSYWIAGIGAIVSAISFLAFTFLYAGAEGTISVSLIGVNTTKTISVPAQAVSARDLADREGLMWVSLVLVLAVLVVAVLFMARPDPFGSRVSSQVQARWTALGFIGAGVLSAVCLVVSLLLIQQDMQSLMQSQLNGLGSLSGILHPDISFNTTWAFGTYLFVAGLATIVAGGILGLTSPAQISTDAPMAATPMYSENQYPQNPYSYPSERYGSTPMDQGAPPYSGTETQYPAPRQPPSQYPPYGQ